MVRIQDLMRRNEKEGFVGRARELAILRQELAGGNENWRLVHVHGPSGIGKTTLLRAFARESGIETLMIAGEACPTPDRFLNQLRERLIEQGWEPPPASPSPDDAALAESLNMAAMSRQGLILFIDTYEACKPIEPWLRDRWLPQLAIDVRVCTAGRYPHGEEWLRAPGWNGLVHNLRLGPLNRQAVERYALSRGIAEGHVRESIERFSQGIPMALTLACDAAAQYGPDVLREGVWRRQTIHALCGMLLQDMKDSLEKRLLDAASVLRRFDQELLEAVAGAEIADEAFRALCKLPFIGFSDEGGWRVATAVREWVKTDLRSRAPETAELYESRALRALQVRLAAAPTAHQRRLIVELLDWHESRQGRQGERIPLATRPAVEADLALLEKPCRDGRCASSPCLHKTLHPELYSRTLRRAAPASFTVVETDDTPVGFYALVPLVTDTRSLLQHSSVFRAFLTQSPQQDDEYLLWLDCAFPRLESPLFGDLLRRLLPELAGKLIATVTSNSYCADVYTTIGFRRIPWADADCAGGSLMLAYQIDLREKKPAIPLHGRLQAAIPSTSVSLQETASLLKRALSHPTALDADASLQRALAGLDIINPNALPEGSAALAVRQTVSAHLEKMSGGTEEERLQAHAIRLAYIQRAGTHETIALRINLSQSTYYRYVKKGFERLASYVLNERKRAAPQ